MKGRGAGKHCLGILILKYVRSLTVSTHQLRCEPYALLLLLQHPSSFCSITLATTNTVLWQQPGINAGKRTTNPPHKGPSGPVDSNLGPWGCEVTVLTTWPLFHPCYSILNKKILDILLHLYKQKSLQRHQAGTENKLQWLHERLDCKLVL